MTIRSASGLHIPSSIPGLVGLGFDPLLGPVGWNLRKVFFSADDVGYEKGLYDSSMYSLSDFGGGATRTRAFVDNEMEVLSLTTGALANDGGYDTVPTFGGDFDTGTLFIMRARSMTAVSQRVAFGMTAGRADVPAPAGDSPATFFIDTAVNANWRVRTGDGTTVSDADYSPVVALTAGTWLTFMIWRTATEVRFRIGDNTPMVRTANLPATNVGHFPAWGMRTLTAAAREIQVSFRAVYRVGLVR